MRADPTTIDHERGVQHMKRHPHIERVHDKRSELQQRIGEQEREAEQQSRYQEESGGT